MIVGRVVELARLRTFLGWSAEDHHCSAPAPSLVVRGAPGIGKTFLIDRAIEDAGEAGALAGVQIVRTCGIRSEIHLPYAGLVELVSPLFDRIAILPAAQREALERALALGPVDHDQSAEKQNDERLTLALATRSLLVGHSETDVSRVLAVIDDAQWLDAESFECILFASRRLNANCRILFATRDTHVPWPFHGVEVLQLDPLTDAESDELVHQRAPALGLGQRTDVTKASEGFPLALVQFTDAAVSSGSWRTDSRAVSIDRAPTLELFGARIDSLTQLGREVLLVAAASGSEDSATIVEACQKGGFGLGGLLDAEQLGMVTLTGDRVHFSHPLLRSAVYAHATAGERRRAHAVLADVTSGTERAWHLAAASAVPNNRAADALEGAGRDAMARRASSAATDAFTRSAELTPRGGPKTKRVARAVQAASLAGRLDDAVNLARVLLDSSDVPRERGAALTALATVVAYGAKGVDLGALEAEIDQIRQRAPIHAATAYTWLALARMNRFDFVAAQITLESAAGTIGFPLDNVLRYLLAAQGDRAGARARTPDGPTNRLASAGHLLAPYWLEDYDELEQLLDVEEERGPSREAPQHCLLRGSINVHRGRWAEAQSQLSDAAELALISGEVLVRRQAVALLARLSAARGDPEVARASLAELCTSVRASPDLTVIYTAFAALGHLELTTGDSAAAVAALRVTEGIALQCGMNDPAHVPWSFDLIEALVRLGDLENAQRATDDLARRVELSGSVSATALLACANAMLAKRCEDELFLAALALNEQAPRPFHEARIRLIWGARLHRERRRADARVQLRAARTGFDVLGASTWSLRAEAELAAAGGASSRRSRSVELSSQELAVANSAAAGLTVKQIGLQLFLSPKTVESHLSAVYRKLAVHSRVTLAAALRSTDATVVKASSHSAQNSATS